MSDNFVIEDPYTGEDMMSSSSDGRMFKIPYLKVISINPLSKNNHLIAVLWIKDHILLSNQIVSTGHEFYRCISTNEKEYSNNYLLIPLYAKMGHTSRKRPVMFYHSGSVKRTLLIGIENVYLNLKDMFGRYANCFPVIFSERQHWMVQFPENPACYLWT